MDAQAREKEWKHQGGGENRHTSVKRDRVREWLTSLEKKENNPEKKQVELPCDTKGNHWIDFAFDQQKQSRKFASYEYFCSIWKEDFKHLVLPKEGRLV